MGNELNETMIGRERELALLDSFLPPDDSLRAALVLASPGIGTSTLVRGWLRRQSKSFVVVVDGREPVGEDHPLLGDGMVDLGRRDPESASHVMAARALELAGDHAGGLVVAIDHADELVPEIAAIMASVAEAAQAKVRVLLAAIGTPGDEGPQLASPHVGRIHDALSRLGPVPVVAVRPLEGAALLEAVAALLPGEPDTAIRDTAHHSNGVLSLVHLSHGSDSAVRWAEHLLERAGDAADVVRLAAVLPHGMPAGVGIDIPPHEAFGVLASVDERDGTARLRITSNSLRSALLAATSKPALRAVVSEAITDVLEHLGAVSVAALVSDTERYQDQPEAIDVLARLERAHGRDVDAHALFAALARSHERAERPLAACVAWREALDSARHCPPDVRLETAIALFRSLREVNDDPGARSALRPVLQLADALNDGEARVYGSLEREWLDADSTSRSLLEQAITASPEGGWSARARAFLAHVRGDDPSMARWARVALASPAAASDSTLKMQSVQTLATALETTEGVEQAIEVAEHGIAQAPTSGTWRVVLRTQMNLVGMLLRAGRPAAAIEQGRAALEAAERLGRRGQVAELRSMTAFASLSTGDLHTTRALLAQARAALTGGAGTTFAETMTDIVAARVSFEMEDSTAAEELRRAEQSVAAFAAAFVQGDLDTHRIRILAGNGRLQEAVALAEGGFADLDSSTRGEAAIALARAAVECADPRAAEVCRALRDKLELEAVPSFMQQRALAEIDPSPAARCLVRAAAIDGWNEAGFALHALELRALTAVVGDASVDDLRALRLEARGLGAGRLESRINRHLKSRGERAPAASKVRGDAPFTERELQIARLVRSGCSNRDIAEKLGIAPATVARILANVYKRHSLAGRTALVFMLDEVER